jgi:hypothetical protein
VESAGAHPAVADVGHGHRLLLLHPRREDDARHHGDHVAEVRDGADEALLQIAEVDVEVAPLRRPPRLRHVLREDFARADALDEHRAEVADERRDEVLLPERVGRPHGGRLLPERAEDAAHDLRLPVEVDEFFFDQPRQHEVAIKLKQLRRLQRRRARADEFAPLVQGVSDRREPSDAQGLDGHEGLPVRRRPFGLAALRVPARRGLVCRTVFHKEAVSRQLLAVSKSAGSFWLRADS